MKVPKSNVGAVVACVPVLVVRVFSLKQYTFQSLQPMKRRLLAMVGELQLLERVVAVGDYVALVVLRRVRICGVGW